MNETEYWKQRCELAETFIEECPCDPDMYPKQWDAYTSWVTFKDELKVCQKCKQVTGPSFHTGCDDSDKEYCAWYVK